MRLNNIKHIKQSWNVHRFSNAPRPVDLAKAWRYSAALWPRLSGAARGQCKNGCARGFGNCHWSRSCKLLHGAPRRGGLWHLVVMLATGGHGLTANVGCMYIHRHYVHAECRNLQWLVMQGRRHNVIGFGFEIRSRQDQLFTSASLHGFKNYLVLYSESVVSFHLVDCGQCLYWQGHLQERMFASTFFHSFLCHRLLTFP